jgi:alpha/beta superfamily hydrolase
MSFPSSPSNNQITIVNGIRYVYSSTKGTWTKVASGTTSVDQFARDKANSANVLAQAAFNQANTGGGSSLDQYARDTANSASSNTIVIQGVNTSQNTRLDAINNYSFGAYAQANLAYAVASDALYVWSPTQQNAQAAFNKANSANVLAQAAFNTANSASSNTIYIQGVDTTQNTRIISVDAFAQASFNQANLALSTSVAVGDSVTVIQGVNTSQNNRMTLIEGVNTSQNTRLDAINNYSFGAYAQANAANNLAQSAFNKANTGAVLNGFLSTSVLVANSTGYIANSDLRFYSSNNVLISPGDVVANGYLKSLNSSGDEGGEIFLARSQANTTLDGGITIDSYQNKIRFFEQGGSARGAYIDLTQCSGGAGTNLLSGGGGTLDQYARDVNVYQNTRITAVDSFVQASFDKANSANSLAQAAFNQANTGGGSTIDQYARNTANSASSNTVVIQGVDVWQNTRMSAIESYAQSAYSTANSGGGGGGTLDQVARNTANSASSNTIILQGINVTQNTRLTGVETLAQAAFDQANTGGGGGGTIDQYSRDVNVYQNTRINTVEVLAQAAFDYANTFVDSGGSGGGGTSGGIAFARVSVYGQANVIADSSADTLNFSAGPGISITTDTATDTITITNTIDTNTRVSLGGLNPFTVPTVNSGGYLANNTNLNFYSSNNTLVVTGNVVGGGIRSTSSASPPNSPTIGDIWYKTTTDVMYRYTSDGTNSYWLDIAGSAVKTGSIITGAGVKVSDTFVANTNQTIFTTSQGYDPGALDVYLNGIKLISGTDYVATDGSTVTLTSPASSGTYVEIIAWAEPINILSPFLFLGVGS